MKIADMDDLNLAQEVSRTAKVAARHHGFADNQDPKFNPDGRHSELWRQSAERHADRNRQVTDEARRRLAGPHAADMASALSVFGLTLTPADPE